MRTTRWFDGFECAKCRFPLLFHEDTSGGTAFYSLTGPLIMGFPQFWSNNDNHFIIAHWLRAPHVQLIATHESPRTTKLYDHTSDEITLDEVER